MVIEEEWIEKLRKIQNNETVGPEKVAVLQELSHTVPKNKQEHRQNKHDHRKTKQDHPKN